VEHWAASNVDAQSHNEQIDWLLKGKMWRSGLGIEQRVDFFAPALLWIFSDDGAIDNLLQVLKSRFVTIEFGPGNERISLYTGDTWPDGKADFKGALRGIMPIYTKGRSPD
jgi:hypothetical protein